MVTLAGCMSLQKANNKEPCDVCVCVCEQICVSAQHQVVIALKSLELSVSLIDTYFVHVLEATPLTIFRDWLYMDYV